jgi:hypothetical protein
MSTSESTSTTGTGTNQYLAGNYAPVTEEITALDLPVEGELPVELNGRYLRNGPNPASEVDGATHHRARFKISTFNIISGQKIEFKPQIPCFLNRACLTMPKWVRDIPSPSAPTLKCSSILV